MFTESINEIYKPYASMLSGENPLVCLDNRFCCVCSSDGKFREGECLLQYLNDVVPEPLGSVMDTEMYRDGHLSCFRIYPIKNEIGESVAYIGEIFDSQAARRIYEKTENRLELLRLCNVIEVNTAAVWECTRVLRSSFSDPADSGAAQLTAIEDAAANLSTVCRNASEYANMLDKNRHFAVIDAGELCSKLERRCNSALAKCGRRIELLIEPEDLRIYADSHSAVVALVNAVQNALLYSPQDSEPVLAVYRRKIRTLDFVEMRVTNENSMFTGSDFSDDVEVNFSYQRVGFGIPIIRRFAELSGGSFSMTKEGGRTSVTITLPAANSDYGSVVLHAPEFMEYNTGRPGFTELMMREVVKLFCGNR